MWLSLDDLGGRLRFKFAAAVLFLLAFGDADLRASVVLPGKPIFPLKTGPTHRYLTDQGNVPFLIQGDSPWSIIAALNNAEVNIYLQDRSQKGFNTLIVELTEHLSYPRGGSSFFSPTNFYGQAPFLTPGDFSTPNEAYFTNADWVIDQAAAEGMAVVLFPCYVGFPGTAEGWYKEMIANGTNKCRQYGRYVGNRYKSRPNIIWGIYGDHNPDALVQPMVEALVAGIQSADTNHIFTAHLQRGADVRGLLSGSLWLQLDTSYTGLQTYAGCLQAYAETPAMPVFQIENYYEGEHDTTPANVRAEAYWAILSGACGQVFGNFPAWPFTTGWKAALNSTGANDMTRVQALFLSRRWTSLVPDGPHTTVTSGFGKGASYVAAARASDGSTMIAYLPVGGGITVDMSRISGRAARAWWFNPRDGTAGSAGVFETNGKQIFKAPDAKDWVLVIDDAAQHLKAPGTVLFATEKQDSSRRNPD